ncbi:hypothetical protein C3E99_08875 [Sphingopyxis sp. MG]|nr:hypothetical protein BWD40_06790 [Sphingopyxis granuli]AVA13933.1 hypothetical protein C3E99_08875 [Sphingopyxis sp. MG]ODU25715.1 MAG: hypothetical protein ABS88_18960 [Sphingopyxis sp. SCN 67-31]
MEDFMRYLSKAAVCLAAFSMVAAPVAVSAAPAFDGARAVSSSEENSEFAGGASWIIGLIGLAAGIAVMIAIADDNDDDSPVSP